MLTLRHPCKFDSGMLIPNPDCCLNIWNGNLNFWDAKSVILVPNPECKFSIPVATFLEVLEEI
jgi:hypothetical protein